MVEHGRLACKASFVSYRNNVVSAESKDVVFGYLDLLTGIVGECGGAVAVVGG